MPADANPNPSFDASILDQLACPACLSDLRLADNRLLCVACGRSYPIVNGIPVLIADRARDACN
jgi:hypothetical protein